MSTSEKLEPEQSSEFDLKHRVTGAAVLLFFGALVLPWLLGPPSEASKVEAVTEAASNIEIEPADIVADDNAAVVVTSASDIEETVYISKITPLDAKGNRDLIRAANEAAKSTTANGGVNDEEANELAKLVREQNAAIGAESGDANSTQNDSSDEFELLETEQQAQLRREQELQAALAAEIQSQQESVTNVAPATSVSKAAERVDVGWVVQVGLFTEKSRSITLIDELRNKGFQASSSIVDTNRGKKTGTRVWLGPFSKRAAAQSEKRRLKSKAGKDGFIRVYP